MINYVLLLFHSIAACSQRSSFVRPCLLACLFCVFHVTATISDHFYFRHACFETPLTPRPCLQLARSFIPAPHGKLLGSAHLFWLPSTCLASLSQFLLVGFAPCLVLVVVVVVAVNVVCSNSNVVFAACHGLTC